MNAGTIRHHRPVFQVKTETQDDYGAAVETWANSFAVPGLCQYVGTREFPIAHKRHSETTARFIIRYREGIDPNTHRIVHDGKTWNIQQPMPDARKRELIIEASELT